MTFQTRISAISVAAIVFILAVIMLAAYGDSPSERAAKKETAIPKASIGEVVSVEDFDFIIHSVNRDGNIVTVEASATNRAKSSKTVMSHRIKLRDTNGNLYDPVLFGGNSIGTLNPKMSGKSNVKFELPATVAKFYVAIDKDTDDYSDKPRTVLVNPNK